MSYVDCCLRLSSKCVNVQPLSVSMDTFDGITALCVVQVGGV